MKVALFSAFPQEVTYIIKSLKAKKIRSSPFIIWFAQAAFKEIIIVQSGIGIDISEAAWKYVVREYSPEYVISAGFCGALYEGAAIGDLIGASHVLLYPDMAVAVTAIKRQDCLVEVMGAHEIIRKMAHDLAVLEGDFLTLGQWTKKSEIAKGLLQGLSFPVCDMETFPLARLSMRAGLPFFAIRAVTDSAHEEIPQELFGVTGANGSFSLSRALRIILGNPVLVPSCIRMGKNARMASRRLCEAIETLLIIL